MTELFILVREPDQSRDIIDSITGSICAKLSSYATEARVTVTERLRELRKGQEVSSIAMLRVTLSGTAVIDFPTMMARLERSLADFAKDAEVALKFEILRLVPEASTAVTK